MKFMSFLSLALCSASIINSAPRMITRSLRLTEIATITAADLKKKIEALANIEDHEKCDVVMVNVLGKKYYDDCHIKHSICVPLYDIIEEAKKWADKGWDKSKEFVIYCAIDECDASEKAFRILRDMGFAKLFAYEGGIREWHLLGYPTGGACSFDYLQPDWQPEEHRCICTGICQMTLNDIQNGIMPQQFKNVESTACKK